MKRLFFLAVAFLLISGAAYLGIIMLEKAKPSVEEVTLDVEEEMTLGVVEETVNTLAPKSSKALFKDIDPYLREELIRFDGFLVDSSGQPIDEPVVMVCDNLEISDPETPVNGFFSIVSVKDCEPGKFVWMEAWYKGKLYESDYYRISEERAGSRHISESSSKRTVPVPEFSFSTMFLVVVIGTLGIAAFRRD